MIAITGFNCVQTLNQKVFKTTKSSSHDVRRCAVSLCTFTPTTLSNVLLSLRPVWIFGSFDYAKQYSAGLAQLAKWLAEGKLKRKFHIVEGLEKAPEALPLLYNGGNTGKLCVLRLGCLMATVLTF